MSDYHTTEDYDISGSNIEDKVSSDSSDDKPSSPSSDTGMDENERGHTNYSNEKTR